MANSWFLRAVGACGVVPRAAGAWFTVALLAAVAVTVPGVAAAAPLQVNAPWPAQASSAVTPPAVSAAIQRDLRLSADEVHVRLARQATAPDVERSMRTRLGRSFGGAWLSEDGTLNIGVTTSRHHASIRAAGAVPRRVEYSEAQLSSAKAALDRYAKTAPVSVYSWYVDLPANRVGMAVEPGQVAAARAFSTRAGLPDRIVQVVPGSQAQPLIDLWGGSTFYNGPLFIKRCSVGFAVAGGFVTAGHCHLTPWLNGPTWLALGGWGDWNYPGVDYAWVENGDFYRAVPTAYDLGDVGGSREALVGSVVCRTGSTTGLHCGRTWYKDATERYQNGDVVYGMTRTDACAEPGDSGGPFMAGDQAQGVLSGGAGTCDGGPAWTVFQPINPILAAYRLTLLTRSSAAPWWNEPPYNGERGTIHTDVNADGYDDAVVFYSYADSQTVIWVFMADGAGGFRRPTQWWNSGTREWDLRRVRFVSADFNGDNRSDIGALYDYGQSEARLWVFIAKHTGGFFDPVERWYSDPGGWDTNRSHLVAGDFTGDGNKDIAVLRGYGTNSQSKLFIFSGDGRTGFSAPTQQWDSGPGVWNDSRSRLVAEDFNGDRITDIAALYGYDGNTSRLWVFLADGSGGFNQPALRWFSGVAGWDSSRTKVVAGDFNGDRRPDIAALYGYGINNQTRLWLFAGNSYGGFNLPEIIWDSGPRNWDDRATRLIAGNFNGDKRFEVGAFYSWDNAQTKLFTFTPDSSGRLQPAERWDSGPNTWNGSLFAQV